MLDRLWVRAHAGWVAFKDRDLGATMPEYALIVAVVALFLITGAGLMATDVGYDPALWQEMADLGWLAMAIDEADGGAGFSFLEVAVLLEEMGRSVFPAPFMSTVVLAANTVALAGSDAQRKEILSSIAAGETIATLRHDRRQRLHRPEQIFQAEHAQHACATKRRVIDIITTRQRAGM